MFLIRYWKAFWQMKIRHQIETWEFIVQHPMETFINTVLIIGLVVVFIYLLNKK